ncbi:hypothetical protein LRHMDP2_1847 [Lacticaseibacillus rhamnosus LRHMDP2]|uniref:Mobile element protein n=1 Tax=Lacticaseibacillus rhamnosus LRHMDP3 TaxID=1203259 RepID=A0AB33XWD8_LACRH|nr:hypothetical protein LRHMDP2_1847 [Lacticaseibacillus rhamnosus LRHMDP2]EKS52328.1 hypothetical protein LRHMDP3_699 [Lacticaseibacillus rhamnosus LRHMDP3]
MLLAKFKDSCSAKYVAKLSANLKSLIRGQCGLKKYFILN